MKRIKFSLPRIWVRSLFALLTFMSIGLTSSYAQSHLTAGNSAANQSITFVSAPVAIQRLETALATMKSELSLLPVHSPSYNELLARFEFYESVLAVLKSSRDISSQAVANAVTQAERALNTDKYGSIPKQARQNVYASLVQLLRI